MKTFYRIVFGLALIANLSTVEAQNTNGGSGQNADTICFGGLKVTPKIEAELAAIPLLSISPASRAMLLPDGVDNSKQDWFRGIFNQMDGCCGQAAGVGYTFTYEVNRIRGLEANVPTHQYPTHFTYNFLNEEYEERGSWPHEGWDVIKEMGVPSVDDYGGMYKNYLLPDRINVWETGYDHYYHALSNKVVLSYEKEILTNGEKIEKIKRWLHNHGNGELSGGLAVFCANVFNYISDILPPESDSATQWVVTGWGNETGGLHAMTIVGYNDNIMYDFNHDGQFTNEGNIDNWERGAFIVVNSWGTNDTWWHNSQHLHHNQGYLYVPYRLVAGFHGREVYCMTVTDTYNPEIVLKARVQHPSRLHVTFYADYDTDASQPGLSADRPYSALNWPKLNAFNNLSMRGLQNNNSPIELGLDFGQFFKEQLDNGGIGKVFFVVKERGDASGNGIYDGEVTNFSLVDYRWNEIFELPYPEERVSIENNGDTRLGINYHLLPFEEEITSDFSMSTDRVARRTVTVDNGTFTINNGVKLDMYGTDDYDCNLVLNTGTNLVIGDNAVITAKRGNCLIDISGEVQVGNNVRFVAEYGATLLVRVNHGRILHLNNCRFENASLLAEATKSISDAAVSSYIPEISVTNCKFTANSWNKEFAIKVDGYTNVTIMDDTICGLGNHGTRHYNDGIIIQNSGNLANNSRVMRNVISGCTGYGLTLLAGRVNVLRNHITACAKGVCLLNNSTVNRFRGNCAALSAEQTQYIHDNDITEVFVARGSVPQEFRFNHITNSNNAYFVQYDGNYDRGTQTILDLEYNNWGINEGLDARFNAVNMGTSSVVFDYMPKWNWGVCLDYYAESIAMEQMGDSLWSNGFYTSAKLSYKEIVELFPTAISADNAMKKLFLIECFSGQDFTSLQNYYRTNSTIQNNDDLKKLASYLSNKCDEEMKNYDAAIAWYENIISDTTTSVNDSIFATIDLGFLYLVMQDEGNKAMGKMKEFIPKSVEAYSKQTNYALHQLRFDEKNESQENNERLLEGNNCLVGICPNPANDIVRVTGKQLERIEIINVMGQRIISHYVGGEDSIYIDLGNVPSGIYFISVMDKVGNSCVKRLIKR
jgi:tetratricopeptide (TPR) repeat protein